MSVGFKRRSIDWNGVLVVTTPLTTEVVAEAETMAVSPLGSLGWVAADTVKALGKEIISIMATNSREPFLNEMQSLSRLVSMITIAIKDRLLTYHR